MPIFYNTLRDQASLGEPGEALFVNIREAARLLSIGRTLLQELLDSGRIRTVRAGRRRLVPLEALRAFAQGEHNSPKGGDGPE